MGFIDVDGVERHELLADHLGCRQSLFQLDSYPLSRFFRRMNVNNSAGMSVVLPGDPRFGAVTRGFNQRWIADPAYVRLCSGPADVVAAVESAVRDGLRITVRSGGHCYENFAYGNAGGVIVDLSLMNGVYVDAETGWSVVDAGATLFDVHVQLYKRHGVALPGGSATL
ncbi:MAG: FAD-binding oxidoreductase [Pseudonocardiales bacterium]|nr:FAD-binding oxidoreductase [Pseudonocardiales bacterium]MBV9030568.1 FAD-binding oxidoreductase [Pseudonocardiales bacterium]MBW0011301.1 FAD-binding oxidoreductase [Pseudonocardiales bacterium]